MKNSAIYIMVTGALIFCSYAFAAEKGATHVGFTIESTAFTNGGPIPIEYTCDGLDASPGLIWTNPPTGTKSFVMTLEDPDAPAGTFIHWVIYDIPGELSELGRGFTSDPEPASGIKQGKNGFGRTGYGGPCPPKGHGRHRYWFILKALDIDTTGLEPGAGKKELDKAIEWHVLGEAKLLGVYQR